MSRFTVGLAATVLLHLSAIPVTAAEGQTYHHTAKLTECLVGRAAADIRMHDLSPHDAFMAHRDECLAESVIEGECDCVGPSYDLYVAGLMIDALAHVEH